MYKPAEFDHGVPDAATRPTVTIEEAARLLGVSRGSAYAAAHDGSLPTIRLGAKRLLVPTAALRRLLQLDGTN